MPSQQRGQNLVFLDLRHDALLLELKASDLCEARILCVPQGTYSPRTCSKLKFCLKTPTGHS